MKYACSARTIKAECQTANIIKRNISDSLKKCELFLRTHLHNQGIVVIGHGHLQLKDHTLTGSHHAGHFAGRTDMAKSHIPLSFKQLGHLAQ